MAVLRHVFALTILLAARAPQARRCCRAGGSGRAPHVLSGVGAVSAGVRPVQPGELSPPSSVWFITSALNDRVEVHDFLVSGRLSVALNL